MLLRAKQRDERATIRPIPVQMFCDGAKQTTVRTLVDLLVVVECNGVLRFQPDSRGESCAGPSVLDAEEAALSGLLEIRFEKVHHG